MALTLALNKKKYNTLHIMCIFMSVLVYTKQIAQVMAGELA